ncbi:phosphoesterase [Acrocarpospora phusangensis]|uniref:Phosphoesterase n=1 Tax=Acrocarpospora phusangensis TaxID=1070424 RepID=A0A919Q894_9ACTN|nr:bifunctional oligoribonuclease/PAP phosphatase NrnA [Acrocarpospora phusangensis]GIH24284.1 phosphoesterase [Acrocarpospora phusangensis]
MTSDLTSDLGSELGSARPRPPAVAEADWQRAVDLVRGHDTVALACHVTPDGDALGSMLAFGQALRQTGRRVVASFGDRSFAVPRLLRFLPGQDLLVPPGEFPAAPELMLTFDASTRDRLGLLIPAARAAGELVVVDHHASNTRFGTLHLVDPRAAATSVLVEELINRLGLRVDKPIATCLYAALVTDTGSFRYSSTTPAVHAMAGRLLAAGLNPDEIARELWDRSPFGYLGVLGAALSRAVLEPDSAGGAGLVWTYVTRADRALNALPYDEVEGVIDVIRKVDGVDVAVVLKEDDAGAWNVSTRSKGAVDVGRACAALGGGGHPSAAGFSATEPPDQTMARLREMLS